MYDKNIAMAGIVTYNPEIKLLKRNIIATSKVLDKIYIVDNGSENIEDIKVMVSDFINNGIAVSVNELGKNYGIAKALNVIMTEGKRSGYKWVLTLDQDSVVPKNIISDNISAMKSSKDIAVISPVVIDRNWKHTKPEREKKKYSHIEDAITSGSITNVNIWSKLGGFDEYMFIDSVDFEYCLRARHYHFGILRNNNVLLSHTIGKTKEAFIFFKWRKVFNHSAFRKYYLIRNYLYMSRKIYGKITFKYWLMVFNMYYKTIFYEKDKLNKLKSMNKGLYDGLTVKVERIK